MTDKRNISTFVYIYVMRLAKCGLTVKLINKIIIQLYILPMKKSTLGFLLLLLFVAQSCKDEEEMRPPALTTVNLKDVSYTMATSGGNITNTGGSSIISRGVCWDISPNPTIDKNKTENGAGAGSFTASITDLLDHTTYFVRAYAVNSSGVGYGNEISFTTLEAAPPVLSPLLFTYIGDKRAASTGDVNSENGSEVTEKGVCWNTVPSPTVNNSKTTNGAGMGEFISSLEGLSPSTTYYARAYATNKAGTGYSNEVTFKTFTITDLDGNPYNAITIGTQVWLDRNLQTTKYSNGDLIPTTTLSISGEASPKYQWVYDDKASNLATYGRLYTWYVSVDERNVCPAGWHVPTKSELMNLVDHLGGTANAGGKLKESGLTNWLSPNTDGTNSSSFTAVPGGIRFDGLFINQGFIGFYWSASDVSPISGIDLMLQHGSGAAAVNAVNEATGNKFTGMSIRCLKD